MLWCCVCLLAASPPVCRTVDCGDDQQNIATNKFRIKTEDYYFGLVAWVTKTSNRGPFWRSAGSNLKTKYPLASGCRYSWLLCQYKSALNLTQLCSLHDAICSRPSLLTYYSKWESGLCECLRKGHQFYHSIVRPRQRSGSHTQSAQCVGWVRCGKVGFA